MSIIFNEDDRAAGIVESEMRTAPEQGLTACKRIVERYGGGRMGAESKVGEGATFWFTIPVSAPDQERFGQQESPLRG